MYKLIKLELKQNNIRVYLVSALVITISVLGLLYLFAVSPKLEPGTSEASMLSSYTGVINITSVVNMACFCVLSAIMFSRFVIEQYSGKRVILLLSYPINRNKVFLAKIVLVSVFTVVGLLLSNFIVFGVFFATENLFPLVQDSLTMDTVMHTVLLTFELSLLAVGIGIISTVIGFVKKSMPVTIVSSVIMLSLVTNLAWTALIPIVAILVFIVSIFILRVFTVSKLKYIEAKNL